MMDIWLGCTAAESIFLNTKRLNSGYRFLKLPHILNNSLGL